ncbi:ParB/RepB/Spo0J family partition protein [Pseudomonas aeruginosa]|uniref:ParB/RepB/Spo0J family partition protein n=1 Tax=Pseudomonas sp. P179 TaxID=1125698 RepID=UPI0003AC7FED|nr:ParB/RepB/Spo0J family partition protein [Pseudomonas sp. P179]EQL43085.1 hypothetical protein M770_33040 [Pseudomonas aeruginosa VRFPA03]
MAKTLNLDSLEKLRDLTDVDRLAQEHQIILLTVDQVLVKPQVREDFKDIEELAETLKTEGQQSPIIVGPMNPDTKKYPLQKGGRRVAAATLLPGFKLKAIVDAAVRDDSDEVFSQLIENVHRDDLNPYEIGKGLAKAKANAKARGAHMSNQDIAKRMSKSETWVSIHLGLADLPDELVDLIKQGITGDTEVLREMRQLKTLQLEVYESFISKAHADGSLSRQQVREAVKLAKGKPIAGKTLGTPTVEGGQGDKTATPPVPLQQETSGDVPPVSHAKPGANQAPQEKEGTEPSAPVTETQTSQVTNQTSTPNSSTTKRNGKGYIPITAERQVIGIKVALDSAVASGYLMNDRVSEDPSKAWCMLMIGGSQQPKQIKVDQIDIVSVAAMETDG